MSLNLIYYCFSSVSVHYGVGYHAGTHKILTFALDFFFFSENGYCRGKKSSSLKDVAMVSLILYLHTVWEVSILNKLQTLLDGEMFTFHIVQPLSRRAWLLFIEVNQTAP